MVVAHPRTRQQVPSRICCGRSGSLACATGRWQRCPGYRQGREALQAVDDLRRVIANTTACRALDVVEGDAGGPADAVADASLCDAARTRASDETRGLALVDHQVAGLLENVAPGDANIHGLPAAPNESTGG